MSPEDPRAIDILQRAMVARVATLSRNRRPHINPLYFVYVDGRIHLGTADRTLAARNARVNPRVTILFNVERNPDDRRVLRIHGRATVRTDPAFCRPYLRRDASKYVLTWRGLRNFLSHAHLVPIMRRYLSSGEKGKACVLEVTPETAEILNAPAEIGGRHR